MLEYRLCCLICAESDKQNFVDCRHFICRTVFGSKQWYIHSKSENNFWSIAPSVVDIYLVMSAITWAQTTVPPPPMKDEHLLAINLSKSLIYLW